MPALSRFAYGKRSRRSRKMRISIGFARGRLSSLSARPTMAANRRRQGAAMNAFRLVFCAATLSALAAFSEGAASQGFCFKNHYILDYPCGVQAGTAPPTFQIPPVPAGVNHWTAIGPDGANVVTLVVDPVVSAIAFAGTTGSGVFKTTDGGASWATANAGLPTS